MFKQTTQSLFQPKAPGAVDMVPLLYVMWNKVSVGENNGKRLGYVEDSKAESWWERIVVLRNHRSENQTGNSWIEKLAWNKAGSWEWRKGSRKPRAEAWIMRNVITNFRIIHSELFWCWIKILALSYVLCRTSHPWCSNFHAWLLLGHLSPAAASAKCSLLWYPCSGRELSCHSWVPAILESQAAPCPSLLRAAGRAVAPAAAACPHLCCPASRGTSPGWARAGARRSLCA